MKRSFERRRPVRRSTAAAMPQAALVLAAALWGLAMTGTKYALAGFDPITLLAVELVAATVLLWLMLLVHGYRGPSSWRLVIALGVLEPALAYVADTLGLVRTSASNAAVISGLESAFVVVLAVVFLGERLNRKLSMAVGVGLLGLVALEQNSWLTGPGLGDGLVLCGALSAAVYTILARGIDDDDDPLAITAHQFAVASLTILPVAITSWANGTEVFPDHVPVRFWWAAALIGIGGFGTSFALYNFAIATVQAGTAALIINLIPAFGFMSAVVLLGEQVTPARLTGAALITASVAMFMWTKPSDQPDQASHGDPAPQSTGMTSRHESHHRDRDEAVLAEKGTRWLH